MYVFYATIPVLVTIWELLEAAGAMSQAKAMEQLNRLASTLSNSVSSTLFSTVSTIKDVLPGNNVTKEFEASEHCASAGPGNENFNHNKHEMNANIWHKCRRRDYFKHFVVFCSK
jgi:hypothetical protein